MAKTNTSGLDRHQRAFVVLMEKTGHSLSLYTMFRDFCELAALSLSNAVDLAQYEQREARYMQIVKDYKADDVARFPEMLALYRAIAGRRHEGLPG